MSDIIVGRIEDPCFDREALSARPAGDLWSIWLSVGRELAARPAEPVRVWRERVRERGYISRMSERELRDIGLTASLAKWEINKPFWRD
jgi:uncharacterized protein YjiS (DUF1127 family)